MGLYVQREALVAAQKSLDIVGNNISNIKTKGYARQKVDVCSVANKGYNLFYDTSVSMAGQGVDIVGVTQYRDALIDEKVRNYTTSYNDYGIKQTVMSQVETVLDNIEADASGFAANFAKFKEALQSFTSDHADRAEIANVAFQTARSAVQQLNYMNSRLDDLSEQTLGDAAITVQKINTIFENMASLNKQITNSYVSMGYIEMTNINYQVQNPYGPLELKDNMNVLIDELAEYGNVDFKEEYNGSFTVKFAGQLVVFNDQYAQMAMTEEHPAPFDMAFEVTSCGKYDPENERYTNLMNKEQWKSELLKYGESAEGYVRMMADNVDITAQEVLTGGALRGYLDVYNGDGVYATDASERAIAKAAANIDAINDTAKQIAALYDGNDIDEAKQVQIKELVEKLNEYAGASVTFNDNGKDFFVMFAGQRLVTNGTANEASAEDDKGAASKIMLNGTDITAAVGNVPSGGGKNSYQGIEYYRDMLNSFAKTMSDKLNKIYNQDIKQSTADKVNDIAQKMSDWAANGGTDVTDKKFTALLDELKKYDPNAAAAIDGNGKLSVDFAGGKLIDAGAVSQLSVKEKTNGNASEFSIMMNDADITENIDSAYRGFRLFDWGNEFHSAAEALRVTEEWESDPEILAHPERFGKSDEPKTDVYDELSNDFIQKVLGAFADESFTYGFEDAFGNVHNDPETFSFEKYIAHIGDNMGVQVEGNGKIFKTTGIMLTGEIDSRDELMAVSMDEEGVDMMNYQKWYNAIARMITTLDEGLDKIINDMGLVGR